MDLSPDAPRTARKRRALLLLGTAVLAIAATAAWLAPSTTPEALQDIADVPAVQADTARVLTDAAARRPVYKYSVLPGGVGSRAELAGRAAGDRVAAAHYASFDIDKAHVTVVPRARAVHVSYRKGDRVYWTRRKVTLAAGETLLSDGRSTIRTRCGNRVSDTPQLPVEASGPGEDELDTIVPTSAPVPEEELPPGVHGGQVFTSAANPTPDTPARTRTAFPLSFPGGIGVPIGGGPIYGATTPPPGSPPGSPDGGTGPTPGDTSAPGGDPANPDSPLLPPPMPVPEPQPPGPHPDPGEPPTEVPEPGTLWLGLAGAGALLLRRRR